jgi:hypothetical protein
MKITFHGGECCGVKHISGFSHDPTSKLEAYINPKPFSGAHPDQNGASVNSAKNFFYGEAPKETEVERLDRYIAYLDKVRPFGVIEIVLCDYKKSWLDQTKDWAPILLERGFVLVTDCINSNSGNRIYIYHRKVEGDMADISDEDENNEEED